MHDVAVRPGFCVLTNSATKWNHVSISKHMLNMSILLLFNLAHGHDICHACEQYGVWLYTGSPRFTYARLSNTRPYERDPTNPYQSKKFRTHGRVMTGLVAS